jgi:ubiquinone/menaquinone biosynthesis C-methylase UbiE
VNPLNPSLRSDDHVLFLDIPLISELQSMARLLMRGSIVALGTDDDVESARRAMAEFDNVMFVAANPDRIPWRDGYFTKVIVPQHFERIMPQISGEVQRVLRPGGTVVRASQSA